METKQTLSWNDRLKVAIVNEAIDEIARLHGEMPTGFDTIEEARESAALIAEALTLLEKKRAEVQIEIDQTRKIIAYQKAEILSPKKRYETVG